MRRPDARRSAPPRQEGRPVHTREPPVRVGTVNVVVHWPTPPPAAFVAVAPCLAADEVAAILTTTRLVVGALVQMDGTAAPVGVGRAPALFTLHDCAVQPAVAVVGPKDHVLLRSYGTANTATMQHIETVADRRRIQFPIIGHTVEVADLARGVYQITANSTASTAGTLFVTENAAAVSNGDGRVQFTAAPGAHRITVDLPAVGLRAAVHAERSVQVIAGEELTVDLDFGAP